MRYGQDPLRRRPSWQWVLLAVFTAGCLIITGVYTWSWCFPFRLPVLGEGQNIILLASYPGFAATLWLLFMGWRRSERSVRRRSAVLLIAFSLIVTAQAAELLCSGLKVPTTNPLFFAGPVLGGVVAPILFAYAILHDRVLDLGFAINRTLVYAVVSGLLLAAFGLIEWAVQHFVPIEGRENNALMDAALAVGVFLMFHRVRDAVEHVIERVFFRRWQKAEAELRKFVQEAAFVTQPPALTHAFALALADYAEGAQAAIYLAASGGYVRAEGGVEGVPERLDADLPALVSLRAAPRVSEHEVQALSAAVIAPMVNRNEVIGVVLLGHKPNGLDFRPDEVELIGWATRQVGLDLHALKVEKLEADNSDLNATVALLRQDNETLRSVVLQRA